MKGTRALTDSEIEKVLESFNGENRLRNACLFLTGLMTGFRISELLSLQVSSVFQFGKIVERVTVERAHMKKKQEGRSVLLHPVAKAAIVERLKELETQGKLKPETFIFRSTRGHKALSRVGAWFVLKRAFESQGLTGKLGCHSMRKFYCGKMYDRLKQDLVKTAKAMGHKSVSSTVSYLSFREEEIDEAILSI